MPTNAKRSLMGGMLIVIGVTMLLLSIPDGETAGDSSTMPSSISSENNNNKKKNRGDVPPPPPGVPVSVRASSARRNVVGAPPLQPPAKRVTETIRKQAFVKMMDIMSPPLWHGDAVVIFGQNIGYLVEKLRSKYKRLAIVGGDTNATALEELRKRYPGPIRNSNTTSSTVDAPTTAAPSSPADMNNHFFHISPVNIAAAIAANVPSNFFDVMLTWDLEGELFSSQSYRTITIEGARILRETSTSRFAVFAFAISNSHRFRTISRASFPRVALKMKKAALIDDDYPIMLLQKGSGTLGATDWVGTSGLNTADPTEFLAKCRSSVDHMQELDRLLRIVADALEECGITYWLDSGTLLGAYRFNAYNPMEDDHDVIVDHDEFIEHMPKLIAIIRKRFEAIQRFPTFIAMDGNPDHFKRLIAQIFMARDNESILGNPQIDLIVAKWNPYESKYEITAEWFNRQTANGFPKNILFSQTVETKWKTKHGYLGSLPILGRQYPVPYDVEGYSAIWYSPSDFMNYIVMRQMKDNKEHLQYCKTAVAKVFAGKQPEFVKLMVARMKEIFPETFNNVTCPLCKCTDEDCSVEKTVVALDPMPAPIPVLSSPPAGDVSAAAAASTPNAALVDKKDEAVAPPSLDGTPLSGPKEAEKEQPKA